LADIDYYEVAREVLRHNMFMSIASATPDGDPWLVAVRNRGFVDGCLSWSSEPDREHSKLIKRNERVAYLLYDSSPRLDDEPKLALYGRAVVEEIKPDAIEGETYIARLTTAWALKSEKVDGVWRSKVEIDPAKIGDVPKEY
jgi:hypothetical protein